MNDAHVDEKKPINSVHDGRPGDGQQAVEVRQPHGVRRRGCRLNRTQGIILAVVVVVIIVLLPVIIALLTTSRCACDGAEDQLPIRVTTPRPTLDPALPWADIRLPRSLIPSLYDLHLTVDVDHFNFSGSVSIDFACEESTHYIIVHVNALSIDRSHILLKDLTAPEQSVPRIVKHYDVELNQFHVIKLSSSLTRSHRYQLSFGHFKGLIEDDLRGLYRSMYKDKNGTTRYLAASQLQSIDARKVFPCLDEPDLKAEFLVTITHSPAYTALSNMPMSSSQTLSNGWKKDSFEKSPVMSTYLLAFVIADFRSRDMLTDSGLKIRIWAQPDSYDQTAYALDFAIDAYKFFADYFGMPEVVPKADHAAIPDFSAGAMENWGLVLYRETTLLHDEEVSSISNKYWVSLVMAHEIAHTWFGNMVTMRWWDDLWLNEGFANTLMYFALDTIYSTWKVFDLQLVNNVYPVMTKDSLLTSHAISTPIVHPDDITQFFDSISYDKGMAVLRLLRGFLGWESFKKGLQVYVKTYKYQNAEMSELWSTFEKANNHTYEIGAIMDTWTRQMGFPVVSFTRISSTKYRLDQERFLLNPDDEYDERSSPYRYKWKIPFIYKIQGDEKEHTQWMDMGSAEITVPPNAWVMGNVDYMGFYRTNYDEEMWKRLTEQLQSDHKAFSAANRAGLISDAFNLARANKLSYKTALSLTSYLHKEEDFVPWKAFFDSMDFLKGMLATSNSFGKLQTYIYNLVAAQYRRVGTSDQGDLLDRNMRGAMVKAACGVGVPDAVDWAKRMFNSWMQYGTKILPDYAEVIYAVGIQEGGEKEWNHLWESAQKTRVASEAEVMTSALAYTQQPWLLWRYARWSQDTSKIRMQDVRNLFQYFASTPLGRSVSLQFMLTNWKDINRRFGMDAFLLRDIIYATTSLINTEYEYNQLYRLYQIYPPAGVASKAADNSLALIRSNIKWMKLNHETIHSWLMNNVPEQQPSV
ncbi:hypothetical protein CAPTEDRAFT_184807 [Capitella teleta]|uniref:Aminopeptidase n=1 Tax=Capitella teleta TaxID=283909 RepID=R7UFW1_CAPTE|nr:hypothetical protein CAPTEDRAFT_184807 [Capitella teleta]|eukprot:ELU05065.1 hypothetical protein CAPTEDRAFT_184807 [Capitella teleta]